MKTIPANPLNLTGILSESKRIINSSFLHFLSLSIFFLPLSIFLVNIPTVHFSGQLFTVDHLPQIHQKPLIAHVFYILTIYILSLCATATITYSTCHAFSGGPLHFFTAVKTLTSTFFPIVSTAIVAHGLLFLISLTFLMLIGQILTLVQTLGFVIDHNSIYILSFSTIIIIIIYFYVNWSLAFAVVVAESKWGFEPLIRSAYLIQGMKSISLLLLLWFGYFGGLLVWVFSDGLHELTGLTFVLITILGSSFLVSFLLQGTAGICMVNPRGFVLI